MNKRAPYRFETALAAAWPLPEWQDVTVLVAVSGGADSVALLAALARLKSAGAGRLVAVHFNHCLRGSESNDDAAFVQQLCQSLELRLELGTAERAGSITSQGDGLEAAARDARYQFLTEAAQKCGARYLALAHTADDQAETVLQRIVRGTGLPGLAGIPRLRQLSEATTIVRPLLDFRRSDIEAYLARRRLSFREDASNADRRFLRNRIRHELVPLLRREYQANVAQSLCQLAQLASEAQCEIDRHVQVLYDRHVSRQGEEVVVNVAGLQVHSDYLLRELLLAVWRAEQWPLQSMGFAEWESLAQLLRAECDSQRQDYPGQVSVRVIDRKLWLQRRSTPSNLGSVT